MNREIEFRAKATNRDENREYRTKYKNGDWVYGLVTDTKNYYGFAQMTNFDGVSGIDVDPNTLGQYVGLKDKNGTKIFEGDIVKVEFDTFDDNGYTLSTRTVIGEVYFDTNEYAYKVLEHLGIFKDGSFEDYNSLALHDCVGCEVIGNIYDNPELLQETE